VDFARKKRNISEKVAKRDGAENSRCPIWNVMISLRSRSSRTCARDALLGNPILQAWKKRYPEEKENW